MLHHVALEVDPGSVAEETIFWTAVGFREVPAPAALGEGYTWLERAGSQIHLMHTANPVVPAGGHVAVVAPDFEAAVARLREGGFEVRPGRELWGEKRAKAISPGGHTVELMAAPPAPATG
jgi:catechol 2,3-dioxygenase-like lactoylglutathione lyase family enzyme